MENLSVNLRLPVPSMIFESSESISFKVEFNLFLKILLPGTIFSILIIRNSEKKGSINHSRSCIAAEHLRYSTS